MLLKKIACLWSWYNNNKKHWFNVSRLKDAFFPDFFQITTIVLVSVINHNHINWLHLFWDTGYNGEREDSSKNQGLRSVLLLLLLLLMIIMIIFTFLFIYININIIIVFVLESTFVVLHLRKDITGASRNAGCTAGQFW